jgi:hypothetical protein
MTIAISGTNGITLDGQFNSASSMGFKNRLINSAMVIDQRNAGASVTITTGIDYVVDRFFGQGSITSKFTAQQSSTVPTGFKNSLLFTSSAATTPSASDYYYFAQPIEGLNVSDLAWGTASASTVTLSFWVRSSLTGTFSGAVLNSATNRSYAFTYTINAANTFEQKTITIAGDTSGTWLTTNGTGILLRFALGAGSTFLQTAGSWGTGNVTGATGTTQWISTSGATLYITGVQLEKGSTATSFDYRPYGTELALCQRYFEKSYNIGTVAGTNTESGMAQSSQNAATSGTGFIGANISWKVSKRAAPTTTLYDVAGTINTTTRYTLGGTTGAGQNGTVQDSNENFLSVYSSGTTNTAGIKFHYVTTAEL